MDNFGIFKLISSLNGGKSDHIDAKTPFSKDGFNYLEQLIKTVLPMLSTTIGKENSPSKEPPKTQNKTGATAEILRRHDDFVQKVYKSHGKSFKQ